MSVNVAAVVLNWESASSTVDCVRSIIVNCSSLNRVVVVDNFSSDNSLEIINSELKDFVLSGIVVIVENFENSGYAGGNNFGIRYILKEYDSDYIWIINNDAYLVDDALSPMLECMSGQDCKKIVGSVVVSSEDGVIECYGGGNNYPVLGKAKLYLKGRDIKDLPEINIQTPDYIMGCSLLIPIIMTEEVGLMDEGYFMYSEEMDWQRRALDFGYVLDVAIRSVVFHEGSGSTGGKSPYYFFLRNRAAIRYNKKFFGGTFAFVSAFNLSFISIIQEYKRPRNLYSAIKGAFAGLLMKVENIGTEF